MANRRVDMSLDDIIRQSKRSRGSFFKQRGGLQRRTTGNTVTISGLRQSQFLNRDVAYKNPSRRLVDARMQIIVQQRAKLQDARDRLNLLAKKSDAREKIKKLKERRQFNKSSRIFNKQGMSITRMIDNSDDIGQGYSNPFAGSSKQVVNTGDSLTITTTQPVKAQIPGNSGRGRRMPLAGRLSGLGGGNFNSPSKTTGFQNPGLNFGSSNMNKYVVASGNGLTVTTANDEVRKQSFEDDSLEHMTLSDVPEPKKLKIMRSEEMYMDSNPRFSSNIQRHSTPVPTSSSYGISPLQGYKVLVSNLQSSVTQEDIQELFSEVGTLRRAVLVKQGMAEIVFFKASDAQKACEIYHNRQLDGKPMMVKLVTPIPFNPISSSPVSSISSTSSIGGWSSSTATQNNPSSIVHSGSGVKVTPDINVIRKALFHKNTSNVTLPYSNF